MKKIKVIKLKRFSIKAIGAIVNTINNGDILLDYDHQVIAIIKIGRTAAFKVYVNQYWDINGYPDCLWAHALPVNGYWANKWNRAVKNRWSDPALPF